MLFLFHVFSPCFLSIATLGFFPPQSNENLVISETPPSTLPPSIPQLSNSIYSGCRWTLFDRRSDVLHGHRLADFLGIEKWVISKNRGTPKWMVYNENLIKMDDLGVPLFSETPKSTFMNECVIWWKLGMVILGVLWSPFGLAPPSGKQCFLSMDGCLVTFGL